MCPPEVKNLELRFQDVWWQDFLVVIILAELLLSGNFDLNNKYHAKNVFAL